MTIIFHISRLIIKEKLEVLTPAEKLQLNELKKKYPFLSKADFTKISDTLSSYDNIDKEKAWKNVLLKKEQSKSKQKHLFSNKSWIKYAAIAVLFIGIGFLFQQGYFSASSTLDIPNEFITLELENGSTKIINEDGTSELVDKKGNVIGNQKGKILVYDTTITNETLVYNTLTVPYGKRFEVQLSDGTRVHLNAGTSLKYPIKFIEDQNRQVFLKGEAFFDVSTDAKHPFVVNAEEMNIRVLGTQFNVSSYPEDEHITTVLLEGSVGVYSSDETYNQKTATLLNPGFKAEWNLKNQEIKLDEADTETHTAWMDGRLILNGVPFNDILKKLERQYNVVFINNNMALENRRFTARFDVENIYQVMQSFSYSASFTYKFDSNKIIINP
ncbi:FecR domain-containing protein [Gelidibacter japonicus]|uniref:FecR family protein n=1 Tax=Gelidibacter japonicus TaxID=1962232 RepID=UPI002021AB7E|nr:FecR domain-containing protein [Gelidibacter japonicus]MCL8006468.1 FecR domain-containing protein [Gelidibacter japonicus]